MTHPVMKISRHFYLTFVVIAWILAGYLLNEIAFAATKPNIVLIFTDDQQFNALAANGNSIVQTPTMDWIASQGVRFTQARAALPVCSPSRATILTGQYNQTNGVENLGDSIGSTSPRLAAELKKSGYSTGVTGKWHLGGELKQTDLGFDYFSTYHANGSYYRRKFDLNGKVVKLPPKNAPNAIHIDLFAAKRSSDFIAQSVAEGKPFFLWHNTQTPHMDGRHAWDALPENLAKYDVSDLFDVERGVDKLPGNWNDELKNKPPYYQAIRNYTKAQSDYGYGDPKSMAQHTCEYYAVITELNDMLEPLMEKLKNTLDPRHPGNHLIENTYVIFMADNGWLMGDHAMTSKSLPFDQSVRVPLLVMGPNVDVGRVDTRQVSNVDIAPTILDLAGVPIPAEMQGKSLLRLLSDGGTGSGVRKTNIVEIWETTFAGNKPILAGYDGRYEVIYTYEKESSERPTFVEFYDIRVDPWELDNMAGKVVEESEAYEAILAIHEDIQEHRVSNLGAPSHTLMTVSTESHSNP